MVNRLSEGFTHSRITKAPVKHKELESGEALAGQVRPDTFETSSDGAPVDFAVERRVITYGDRLLGAARKMLTFGVEVGLPTAGLAVGGPLGLAVGCMASTAYSYSRMEGPGPVRLAASLLNTATNAAFISLPLALGKMAVKAYGCGLAILRGKTIAAAPERNAGGVKEQAAFGYRLEPLNLKHDRFAPQYLKSLEQHGVELIAGESQTASTAIDLATRQAMKDLGPKQTLRIAFEAAKTTLTDDDVIELDRLAGTPDMLVDHKVAYLGESLRAVWLAEGKVEEPAARVFVTGYGTSRLGHLDNLLPVVEETLRSAVMASVTGPLSLAGAVLLDRKIKQGSTSIGREDEFRAVADGVKLALANGHSAESIVLAGETIFDDATPVAGDGFWNWEDRTQSHTYGSASKSALLEALSREAFTTR